MHKLINARSLLVFASIACSLTLLEIGTRLLMPPLMLFENYGDTYLCSANMGWVGRPNYQGQLTREEYSHPIQFNQIGMYDTDHALKKPAHIFRILWIGDSFAQALQVDESETAHQQLENLLNEQLGHDQQQFEVISIGVMGWGTGQELSYYREQGRRYQADLVLLLFFMGNDVNNNLPGHALTINGFNCFAPYYPICDETINSEAWSYIPGLAPAWGECSSTRKWSAEGAGLIQRNSYLFARIEPLLLAWQERRRYGKEFGLPFAALYLPDEEPEVRYGWQVTEGLLHQFNHEVEADGADFSVAIIGPREVMWLAQLNEEQRQSFYLSNPSLSNAEINYPNQRLRDFLEEQQIPHLDLQPPMITYMAETGAKLYLPIDRHWTADGNRVAAELLVDWLIGAGLVESTE
ncbi:SGNH/GDSL hydrolase family protein [Anaerolineales bacterium HSG24]|nr:SGNH/GDSL hydrolase family protein [Anaerolineales bacterium HSG24]